MLRGIWIWILYEFNYNFRDLIIKISFNLNAFAFCMWPFQVFKATNINVKSAENIREWIQLINLKIRNEILKLIKMSKKKKINDKRNLIS